MVEFLPYAKAIIEPKEIPKTKKYTSFFLAKAYSLKCVGVGWGGAVFMDRLGH